MDQTRFSIGVAAGALGTAMFLLGVPRASAGEPLYEWSADRDSVTKRTLKAKRGPAGTLGQDAAFDEDSHLIFNGGQFVTLPGSAARALPGDKLIVEARVRIDEPHPWGAIITYAQDNGSHERGWTFGYNGNRFSFKVSVGGALTGAVASKPFTPGEWVDLLGTFDGEKVDLYLDGRLSASTPIPGKIALPKESTPFVLGCYKDDDEHYPIKGRIASVKISTGELSKEDLAKLHQPEDKVVFSVQPRVSFPRPKAATVAWQAEPGEASLYYGTGKVLDQQVKCVAADGRFETTLDDLLPSTAYRFRIATGPPENRRLSNMFELDTRFNLSAGPVAPLAQTPPTLLKYCDEAISLAPDQAGYALVLGLDDGTLTAALGARSRLHIIAADADPAKVAVARKRLYQAGLLGHRVSVLLLENSETAPWTEGFADLILSELPRPALPDNECLRLLRPKGGTLVLTDKKESEVFRAVEGTWTSVGERFAFQRRELKGAKDWTHQYGTPGNASYTGEELGEVSATSGMKVQWIGRPGGDFGIDRGPRMPAPLAANGRLFHQGMNRLIALNAFNGAVLWSYEIPSLRRLNIPHDCSNWSIDSERVFLAIRDRLWILDARTGALEQALPLPAEERASHEWGYVANEGDLLIGSAVRANSMYHDYWGAGAWYDKVGAMSSIAQVCSDRIFAYRKSDPRQQWAYGQGLILNSTIALRDGKLYFLENRELKLSDRANSRVSDRKLWLNLTTVCLDAGTGEIIWEKPGPRPVHLTAKSGFIQAAYGIASERGFLTMLSEGTINKEGVYQKAGMFRCTQYDFDGEVAWQTESPWEADHHGVHFTHPVVTETRLYLSPHVHDVATGKALGISYGPRRGCSTAVATKNALMFRILGEGNSPLGLWNQQTGSVSRFMKLRPSCWLNTLPTQGMLLIPEGGAGCSCGGWMETSVGFLPKQQPKRLTTPDQLPQ